jgi:phosphotransferase system HPr (HPr) family protein
LKGRVSLLTREGNSAFESQVDLSILRGVMADSTPDSPVPDQARVTDAPPLCRTFVMTNPHGLHARPSALLVKTLLPFDCSVDIEVEGRHAPGNSIITMLSLSAGNGARITFTICGPDAARAMAAVNHLFETQFQEAYPGHTDRQ